MENKKVLLTGISGSIGIHFLAHIFHNTNWDIIGISTFRHRGESDRINEMLTHHPEWQKRLTMIMHDLIGPFSERTKQKIGKIDYIINLASLSDVEASIHDPITFIQNNTWSTLNMLEYAREIKPEAFIQFSTDEVYGPTTGKNDGYKEWDAQVPSNPYAGSKSAQESIAISYWRTYNVPLILTNTMNNFGEMQSSTKFPVMIQKSITKDEEIIIHGDEEGIGSRSYIHSRNVADAVLFILKNTKPHLHQPGQVDKPDRYHIAGDKQLDNLELAQLIAKLMGRELKYKLVNFHHTRSGHDKHYGLDDSKLKGLGWVSPVDFETSLKNTIEWQTVHKEWIE